METYPGTLTDISDVLVGHSTSVEGMTGCTVILTPKGAVGGVDQRGGAPGTRETDLLKPMHLVQEVHGILLGGGSAFGLDAASGVMRWLEENGYGFQTGDAKVPIVPAAILYDLTLGNASIRPDGEMGYQACINASEDPVQQGNIGAGTGATIGKVLGMMSAMKSGIGTSSIDLGRGLHVGALMAVNAFGDIIHPESGKIIAGARTKQVGPFKIGSDEYLADTLEVMKSQVGKLALGFAQRSNTVIGVVATNARLTKEEANKIAQMAHNGIARTIRPAHTLFDGDTIFALATGKKRANVNLVGAYASIAVERAILNAVLHAESTGEIPAYQDIQA